jgi:hypothetical protein
MREKIIILLRRYNITNKYVQRTMYRSTQAALRETATKNKFQLKDVSNRQMVAEFQLAQ